jgi:hypothetical protein
MKRKNYLGFLNSLVLGALEAFSGPSKVGDSSSFKRVHAFLSVDCLDVLKILFAWDFLQNVQLRCVITVGNSQEQM